MTPRTILYTGKGGVGKTSVAAATARRCAGAGLRTIVLSTDPAHSLSDSLECELGSAPTKCGESLWGQEVQAQEEMERHWEAVQDWMGEMLAERGVDRITAEELTVPPGMDEMFSLLQLKRHHESGDYDAIVVDCAPTGETLRLLSFPDVAGWWLEKVFPLERKMMAAARPFARAMLDVSLPPEKVFDDVERLMQNLGSMNVILRDRATTTIRLVMNPDRMVIKEAMRTFTYLNLYGYLTDAVIVNRVFPEEVDGGYFGGWRAVQQEQMELVESAFTPVPILMAPYFPEEVVGPKMLDRLADELFADGDAGAVLHEDLSQELTSDNGTATLRLPIPFVEKADIGLKKIGLEVVVRVGGQKRTIMLPPALAAYRPRSAQFEDGALSVHFERSDDGSTADDASTRA
ncbi:MAG: arsenite/tail-anchored protein-transporting ATPase [Thermoleophilaceae bacterium]|jgi:arsenite-transporting ATPase|nr:arsenite/tail-anchored protein-transporting ATPase [Thermoleophilaceae bacterium]